MQTFKEVSTSIEMINHQRRRRRELKNFGDERKQIRNSKSSSHKSVRRLIRRSLRRLSAFLLGLASDLNVVSLFILVLFIIVSPVPTPLCTSLCRFPLSLTPFVTVLLSPNLSLSSVCLFENWNPTLSLDLFWRVTLCLFVSYKSESLCVFWSRTIIWCL